MEPLAARAARAFSSHAFQEAYPYLSPHVRWDLVGGRTVEGKEAVIAVCEEAARELTGTATAFSRFDAIVADERVIIQSQATYRDEQGRMSEVAACDIYETRDGTIARITSYNIGLSGA
jgi:ketosteroid isomerase-like protein